MFLKSLQALAAMLALSPLALAQAPLDAEQGVKPYGTYSGSAIDNVSVASGNVSVRIPLYSAPQRGNLGLSFSLYYGNPGYQTETTCNPQVRGECTTTVSQGEAGELEPSTSVAAVLDQQWTPYLNIVDAKTTYVASNGVTEERYQAAYDVVEPNKTVHGMAFESDIYRSVDGTGFMFAPSYADPQYSDSSGTTFSVPSGTVTDNKGTQYILGMSSYTMTDVDGNQIAYNGSAYSDTMGRSVPAPPTFPTSSDVSSCPTLNASNQSATGSSVWTPPGPNGTTSQYLFCYASVYVRTNYLQGTTNSGGFTPYERQESDMLQSVVLPDGTYWGFVYDAADPNSTSSLGFGDLTSIITPQRGSINYTWGAGPTVPCSSSGSLARSITNRTINFGGSEASASWQYVGQANPYAVTVTQPDSSTVVSTFTEESPRGACSLYETQRQYFAANASSPTQTIATNYQTTGYYDARGLIAAAPTGTTTTWANGQSFSTATQYAPAVAASYYDCAPSSAGENCIAYDASISNLEPVKSSTQDYSGQTLKSIMTNYLWQTNPSYLSANLLNTPTSVITSMGGSTNTAETDYTYDQSGQINLAPAQPVQTGVVTPPGSLKGHLTTTTMQTETGTSLSMGQFWLSTGELDHTTDTAGNLTSFLYSSTYDGTFPTQMTNALGQSTTVAYDFNTGLKTAVTDTNSQTTSYAYDSMRRTTCVHAADGGQTNYTYNSSSYSFPNTVTTVLLSGSGSCQNGASGPVVTTAMLDDGMGRTTESILASDPSGPDYTVTTYDARGRVASVTNPYRSTQDSTYGLTSYTYDVPDRPLTLTQPDNTTQSWAYTGNTSAFTNEKGIVWDRSYDALGRLTQVEEPDPSDTNAPTTETDYQYDALNDLTRVDQWGGPSGSAGDRVRTFSYDGLARLMSAANPESGSISYYYTTAGNALCAGSTSSICRRQDARGVTTNYAYDALSRLTGKNYQNDPTNTSSVSYTYDVPVAGWNFLNQTSPAWTGVAQTNLIGRLSYESNSNSTLVYGYDPVGRTLLKSVCTPSTCGSDHYDLHSSYDLAGDVTFADRGLDAARNAATPGAGYYYGGLTLGYNPAAQLSSAQSDVVDAAHPQSILANMNYVPSGQIYTAEVGGQYGQASDYDKRFRLQDRVSVDVAGQTVLSDHWDYDAAGNMMDQNDSSQGEFQYGYDNLNRVMSAAVPPFSETYSYDPWGNQTAHTAVEGSSYQWNYMPTVQNRASNPGVQYDAAGNMTADGQHSYTYDAENRVSGVADQGVGYDYDPEGMRVATLSGGAVTAEYLYDMSGALVTTVNNAGTLVRAILRADGQHWGDFIGAAGSGGVRTEFRLVNAVGTLVANGDSQGNFVEGCLSGPFGDGQDCNPNYDYTETHFADKLRDAATNNDYFGARYFNSTMGRFLSPDWSSSPEAVPYANLSDPQSLNLYGYAGNNPLSRIDADGHNWFTDFLNGVANATYRPLEAAIQHPIVTGQALGNAVAHPISTAQALRSGVVTTSQQVMTGNPTAVGTALGTAGMFFVPGAGEAGEAAEGIAKAGQAAEAATDAAKGLGNVGGGATTASTALTQAESYLGPGYQEIAPGVYRSADGTRQFRMTGSDLTDPRQGPHVHFESIGPDGRMIIENSHVGLNDQ